MPVDQANADARGARVIVNVLALVEDGPVLAHLALVSLSRRKRSVRFSIGGTHRCVCRGSEGHAEVVGQRSVPR